MPFDLQVARLKRVTLGASGQSSGVGGGIKCPICDVRDVSSEHIAMHFTGELNQYIEAKMPPGGQTCNLCTNFKAHPGLTTSSILVRLLFV